MARAQKSYIEGSTSPSSLIQTACFFVVERESVATWVVSAVAKAANIKSTDKILANNFILSIYEVLDKKAYKIEKIDIKIELFFYIINRG